MPRGDLGAYRRQLCAQFPGFDPAYLEALLRRHGTRSAQVLRGSKSAAGLGVHFGHTLYAAEVDYMIEQEWASNAEDVLWRRSKCGLHLSAAERDTVTKYMRGRRTVA